MSRHQEAVARNIQKLQESAQAPAQRTDHVHVAVGHCGCSCVINGAGPQSSRVHGMVANLDQSPHVRPVVSSLLPALLRQGTMWIILSPAARDKLKQERWLLARANWRAHNVSGCYAMLSFLLVSSFQCVLLTCADLAVHGMQEHLNCMAIPQYPHLAAGGPFPWWSCSTPPTVAKKLAGNDACIDYIASFLVSVHKDHHTQSRLSMLLSLGACMRPCWPHWSVLTPRRKLESHHVLHQHMPVTLVAGCLLHRFRLNRSVVESMTDSLHLHLRL